MRIAMIGAGYVGLVSAACFSEFGSAVVCVEADASRLAALRAGDIPFFEPGLPRLCETELRIRTAVLQRRHQRRRGCPYRVSGGWDPAAGADRAGGSWRARGPLCGRSPAFWCQAACR